MERYRCPHCGHSTPPGSPGLGPLEDEKKSVERPLLEDSPRTSLEEAVTEPRIASELYRPLWDLFGLTTLSVMSMLLYFFLSPGWFPWFVVVSAFWGVAWAIFHFFKIASSSTMTAEQKRDGLYDIHIRLACAVSFYGTVIWMFIKPWHKPWFIFIFSAAAALLTLHYSIAYIDWKRLWLYPQMQLYLNAVMTSFVANSFFSKASDGFWWIWPTLVWGVLILIQLIIFCMITQRRIRLTELDPESQTRPRRKASPYRIPSYEDLPLLADHAHEFDSPLTHTFTGHHTPNNPKRPRSADPRAATQASTLPYHTTHPYLQGYEVPTPPAWPPLGKGKKTPNSTLGPSHPSKAPISPYNQSHQSGYASGMPAHLYTSGIAHNAPIPIKPFSTAAASMNSPTKLFDVRNEDPHTLSSDIELTIEPGTTPFVEHIHTSSDPSLTAHKFGNNFKTGSKYARAVQSENKGRNTIALPTGTQTTTAAPSRPIAMRVVHHDENNAEIIDSSLAGSDGIYIDVVRIPDKGFG